MKFLPIINLFIFFSAAAVVQAVYVIFFLPAYIPVLFMAIIAIVITKIFLKRNWTESMVITLLITEISWVLLFMPFGYLIQSAILLIIFYILWDILKCQYKTNLKKIIINNLLFGTALIVLLLFTSKWLLV